MIDFKTDKSLLKIKYKSRENKTILIKTITLNPLSIEQ